MGCCLVQQRPTATCVCARFERFRPTAASLAAWACAQSCPACARPVPLCWSASVLQLSTAGRFQAVSLAWQRRLLSAIFASSLVTCSWASVWLTQDSVSSRFRAHGEHEVAGCAQLTREQVCHPSGVLRLSHLAEVACSAPAAACHCVQHRQPAVLPLVYTSRQHGHVPTLGALPSIECRTCGGTLGSIQMSSGCGLQAWCREAVNLRTGLPQILRLCIGQCKVPPRKHAQAWKRW